MNSPAQLCRQVEEREERGRVDLAGYDAALERRGATGGTRLGRVELGSTSTSRACRRTARGSIPLTPTPEIVREAEMEAAEAQHALTMAEPDCGAERLDALRRFVDITRNRALKLRKALDDAGD